MTLSIEQYLHSHGPRISSDVIDYFRQQGVTHNAARQRVSRCRNVKRLTSLQFANRSRFLYLPDQFAKQIYWDNLSDALKETSLYGNVLAVIEARGGSLPRSLFSVYSGSTTSPMRGHLLSDTILKNLCDCGMLTEVNDPKFGPMVKMTQGMEGPYDSAQIQSQLLVEAILLKGIKDWLRKLGFVSYEKVAMRGGDSGEPSFGQFLWDLTAPSYIHPFREKGQARVKPGFLVCDVLLTSQVTQREVGFFISKARALTSMRRIRPFMAILVTGHFSKEAFELGRRYGLVFTTPRNLLGDDVAEALNSLMELLTKQARKATGSQIYELFSSLSKIEGAALNLRGPLFELTVNRLAHNLHGGQTDIGKRVFDPKTGNPADIDIFLVNKKCEVRCFECKGKEPGGVVTVKDVEDWLSRQIPRIKAWVGSQSRFSNHKSFFEIWTTGKFTTDARKMLQTAKRGTKKYAIDWRDGKGILQLSQKTNEKRIVEMLREHFVAHPLVLGKD